MKSTVLGPTMNNRCSSFGRKVDAEALKRGPILKCATRAPIIIVLARFYGADRAFCLITFRRYSRPRWLRLIR